MTPEEFRVAGHALVDWVADFRTTIAERPVQATVSPGDIRRSLPTEPPITPDGFDAVLRDLTDKILPGTTHLQSPNFFGYFPANQSLASVLGDIAAGGIGALGITWISNPALTEVEEVMCDWMRQLVGLSPEWKGAIHDTASTATFVALLAARERATDYSLSRGGLQAVEQPLVVYTSPQAHSSVQKAALLAGYGNDNLRMVDTDPVTFAMNADALREAIADDIAHGRTPAAIVAAVGTTGTTAIDPVRTIVDIAAAHDIWVHVDAALAGSAMLLPECRYLWDGVEGADSVVWNPHKWMGTALDCSLLYVRKPEYPIRVMSNNPSYLQTTVDDQVTSYKDWGIPLGRRFRSLKLWFQLRIDGIDSIQARLRRDLQNAQWFAERVRSTEGWTVLAPVVLQTVCVRHELPGMTPEEVDTHTLRWAAAVNASGRAFVTPSMLDGRWMVRVSIGAEPTEIEHVEALWDLLQELTTP